MWLAKVTSPACDDFVSLGKTKAEALSNLAASYKAFYDYEEEDLEWQHGYSDFEKYIKEYLGANTYKITQGETVVCGYDVHYKNGERIKRS